MGRTLLLILIIGLLFSLFWLQDKIIEENGKIKFKFQSKPIKQKKKKHVSFKDIKNKDEDIQFSEISFESNNDKDLDNMTFGSLDSLDSAMSQDSMTSFGDISLNNDENSSMNSL
jgi:hypothetical protein